MESLTKRVPEKAITGKGKRERRKKMWEETTKEDTKRRNLTLKMLKIKANEALLQTGRNLIIRDDGQALKRKMEINLSFVHS